MISSFSHTIEPLPVLDIDIASVKLGLSAPTLTSVNIMSWILAPPTSKNRV